jgi:hypothetical protein
MRLLVAASTGSSVLTCVPARGLSAEPFTLSFSPLLAMSNHERDPRNRHPSPPDSRRAVCASLLRCGAVPLVVSPGLKGWGYTFIWPPRCGPPDSGRCPPIRVMRRILSCSFDPVIPACTVPDPPCKPTDAAATLPYSSSIFTNSAVWILAAIARSCSFLICTEASTTAGPFVRAPF